MAFITQLPTGFVTGGIDGFVLDTGQTSVLNNFTNGKDIDGDIAATNEGGDGSIAEPGETLTVSTTDGGTLTGEYVGAATLSTVNITVLGIANLKLNDINGQVFASDEGTPYFISEDPITNGRLGATLSVNILGQTISVDAPVSEIAGALNTAITAAGQAAYDTAFNAFPSITPIGIKQAAGEAARLPFTTLNNTLSGLQTAVQNTLDTVVFTLKDGTGTLAVVCFAKGAMIETARGLVAIENLTLSDHVATKTNGLQQIRWIGSVKMSHAALQRNPNLQPIRIKAGALGASIPSSDLVVSPQHRVLVRSKIAQRMFGTSEILVAAKQLLQVEGVDIAHDLAEIEYFHILFDQHEVIIANGAAAESLFTGPEALKSVSPAAKQEIFALFPELQDKDYEAIPAYQIASGRMSRKLAVRHIQNRHPLVF